MSAYVWFGLVIMLLLAYSEKIIKDEDNDEGGDDE